MKNWHHRPIIRLITAAIVGVGVGLACGAWLGLAAGLVAGWGAAAVWLTAWILLVVWRMNPAETKSHALREDPGRRTARAISSIGSIASFAAVAVVILRSHDPQTDLPYAFASLAVFSVLASWALIQVDYMLRYARIYYSDPAGGIDFNDSEDPQYSDFAYFAAGLGMTYQVADTNVSTKELRKVVLGQSMLGYLFGAVILGTVINLVSNL